MPTEGFHTQATGNLRLGTDSGPELAWGAQDSGVTPAPQKPL